MVGHRLDHRLTAEMPGGHGRRRNVTDRAKGAGLVDRGADGSDRHVLPIMIRPPHNSRCFDQNASGNGTSTETHLDELHSAFEASRTSVVRPPIGQVATRDYEVLGMGRTRSRHYWLRR